MEILFAVACHLTYITGKSNVPIHPKHLVRAEKRVLYRKLLNKGSIVLDAGCGSGQHSIQIAKYVKKVIGLDYDQRNLEIAKKAAAYKNLQNIEFKACNLEKKLPLNSSSVDLVILFDILEHLNHRQNFLREIKRVVKPNGFIIVAVPNLETSWKKIQRKYGINSYSDPDHKIEYTKETITKELTEAGFKLVEIKPISYDTPWIGLIDFVGGLSLSLYKKLSAWKENRLKLHPDNCSGYLITGKLR